MDLTSYETSFSMAGEDDEVTFKRDTTLEGTCVVCGGHFFYCSH